MDIRNAAIKAQNLLLSVDYNSNPYVWNHETLYSYLETVLCTTSPSEWICVNDFMHLTTSSGVELSKLDKSAQRRLHIHNMPAFSGVLYILRRQINATYHKYTNTLNHHQTCKLLCLDTHPLTWNYDTVHAYVRKRFEDAEITACIYDSNADGLTIGMLMHPMDLNTCPLHPTLQKQIAQMLHDWYS